MAYLPALVPQKRLEMRVADPGAAFLTAFLTDSKLLLKVEASNCTSLLQRDPKSSTESFSQET
jgi:hypothetical protein